MTDGTQWRIEEIGMPIGGYARWGIYMNRNGKDTLVDDFATEQEAVDELDIIHGGRMTPTGHCPHCGAPYYRQPGDIHGQWPLMYTCECNRGWEKMIDRKRKP